MGRIRASRVKAENTRKTLTCMKVNHDMVFRCAQLLHMHILRVAGCRRRVRNRSKSWNGLTFRDRNPPVKNIVLVGGVLHQAS